MFWDNVEISATAGNGGNGLTSFRRERGEAKGGPDGGDGGDGGSVVIVADGGETTLGAYARKKTFAAKSGQPGGKTKKHGKSADDLRLKVPVGTIVYDGDRALADLAEPKQEVVVAKGGSGGFGNAHFTSSTRRTPRHAELGEPGETAELRLELKLVADIGLVGVPSAGKSTLLSRITAAKPKIADYPFTTTVPGIGIARVDGARYAVADIPGLIEGAHKGKGLGDAFLRHIERSKTIIHLLVATAADPVEDYRKIQAELKAFDPVLLEKPEVVALNKIDTIPDDDRAGRVSELEKRLGKPLLPMSAVSGEGVQEVLRAAVRVVQSAPTPVVADAMPTFTLKDLAPRAVSVKVEKDRFTVTGPRLERLAAQTDFANPQAADRFWWIASRMGLDKRLQKLDAEPGVVIKIAGKQAEWPGRR
jgi:GTP-binding protein